MIAVEQGLMVEVAADSKLRNKTELKVESVYQLAEDEHDHLAI